MKLKQGRFRLALREKFLMLMVVRHWRCPREAVGALRRGPSTPTGLLPSYVYAGLFRGSERKQEQNKETRGSSFIFSL